MAGRGYCWLSLGVGAWGEGEIGLSGCCMITNYTIISDVIFPYLLLFHSCHCSKLDNYLPHAISGLGGGAGGALDWVCQSYSSIAMSNDWVLISTCPNWQHMLALY